MPNNDIGLARLRKSWTEEEENYLIANYYRMDRNLLAKHLQRSEKAVRERFWRVRYDGRVDEDYLAELESNRSRYAPPIKQTKGPKKIEVPAESEFANKKIVDFVNSEKFSKSEDASNSKNTKDQENQVRIEEALATILRKPETPQDNGTQLMLWYCERAFQEGHMIIIPTTGAIFQR